ncbi:hypothetical protein WG68_03700 [Arsukibacterium ikkense]|uniref:Flagellar rod protein FlaI n=1 Tax=Arsukibacterium ikkense TaxID=336831 RepID=A0A0M2VD52_9GAMM|nr:hypothetical protein [Arsukibacterium ikkense]KKO47043.1 hypothetical protein WG68_03700 [Arsukibacterium ikkense]
MSALEKLEQQCASLREKVDLIILQPGYDIEQVAILVDQLNQHLCKNEQPKENIDAFAWFLQQNLDWLQATMAKLVSDREAVANSMLQIKKGRQAQHSYGQHN